LNPSGSTTLLFRILKTYTISMRGFDSAGNSMSLETPMHCLGVALAGVPNYGGYSGIWREDPTAATAAVSLTGNIITL
jgi:hypothetical protein